MATSRERAISSALEIKGLKFENQDLADQLNDRLQELIQDLGELNPLDRLNFLSQAQIQISSRVNQSIREVLL